MKRIKTKISMTVIIMMVSIIMLVRSDLGDAASLTDANVLTQVMKNSDVTIHTIMLSSSNELGKPLSTNNIRSFKHKVAREFSLELKKQSHPDDHGMVEYNGRKMLSGSSILNVKLAGKETKQGKYTVFLLTKLVSDQHRPSKLRKYYDEIAGPLKELGFSPVIRATMQGSLNKKMNHSEQHALILSLFQKLQGNVTEGLNEQKVISLTGFSETLHHPIMSNHHKVNLQIASRYDSLNKKTIITMGTPIITLAY